MHDVSLKQLRALSATVAAGTMVGAASALHVTPPAVSQHLRQLERWAGLPLLERTDRGYVPTTAGRELVATMGRIEEELAACDRSLQMMREAEAGSVALGAVSTAKYFAPQALAAFWHQHPEVDIALEIGNRSQIVERLAERDLDLVIMGSPPVELDCVHHHIGEHPHVAIAGPDHPLVGGPISLERFARATFVVREPGSGTRGLMERLFAPLDLQPRIAMVMASNESIKQAVMAGLGVSVISAHTVATELADGRLVVIDVDGLPVMRRWYAVRLANHRLLPAAQALCDYLVSEGAHHFPT